MCEIMQMNEDMLGESMVASKIETVEESKEFTPLAPSICELSWESK